MIKGISFSTGVRTWSAFGWISIIFFTSTISHAAVVELKTFPQVTKQCGDTVSLKCEATSTRKLDVILFTWVFGNTTVCEDENNLCVREENTSLNTLSLTLRNVMPRDQGKYLCKIRSIQGMGSSATVVTVQDCLGSFNSSTDDSHATCWFSGVYPRGSVHWFRGDVNLTDSARPQTNTDQHGLFSLQSTVDLQQGNLSEPYECSLWIPSAGKYLYSKLVYRVGKNKSSGNIIKLQWITVMVELVMLKFLT